MTSITLGALADRLRTAEATRQPCPPLRDELRLAAPEMQPIDAAYAVQNLLTERRLANGERIVGRKIGLTSKAVQAQLGVDAPDYGVLFASMAIGSGQGIALEQLIQPKLEAEIAIVLERDLTHERHTYADILRASAFALPAIEVVDSRIGNWDIRLSDTIADNGSSARYLLGSRPVPLSGLDLENCAMRITRHDQIVSQGAGRLCLGNPLNALCWLADTMAARGTPLLAGHTILTGALGPMVAVAAPSRFTCHIEGLDPLQAIFE